MKRARSNAGESGGQMNQVLRYGRWVFPSLCVGLAGAYAVLGFPDLQRFGVYYLDASQQNAPFSARAHRLAQKVCRLGSATAPVLAPLWLSDEIASRDSCSPALLSRTGPSGAPMAERMLRKKLVKLVDLATDLPFSRSGWFIGRLQEYQIEVVVMTSSGIQNRRVKTLLRQFGYEKVEMVDFCHIWKRTQDWSEIEGKHMEVAKQVSRYVPEGSWVLAPFGISRALNRLGCCRPLILKPPAGFLDKEKAEQQLDVLEEMLGRSDAPEAAAASLLERALEQSDIRCVVLTEEGAQNRSLKDLLRKHNYKVASKREGYRNWIPRDLPDALIPAFPERVLTGTCRMGTRLRVVSAR